MKKIFNIKENSPIGIILNEIKRGFKMATKRKEKQKKNKRKTAKSINVKTETIK